MNIESNMFHFVSFINVTKIVSKLAQWAERAGPSLLLNGPGRKKSAHAHL